MMGMEKMLASMIGLTPDEMKAYVGEAINLLVTLNARLERIESALGIDTSEQLPPAVVIEHKQEAA